MSSKQVGLQTRMQIQKTALQADFPAGNEHFHSFQPKLHLYPASSTCITLICLLYISKSLFIGIYQGLYHFSYKKDGEYFPSFLQCCPFMAENWHNFRSLYYSFLTVTLACHYWGFLCPPSGAGAQRTTHYSDKGHQLHPLFLIHPFIPLSAQPSVSFHSMLGLTWRHPDILSRF